MTAAGWQSVYRVVRRVPEGRVTTYGEVATRAGMPGAARQVGWALHALDAEEGAASVPWQRVVNARGTISERGAPELADLQRALLEAEGVVFDARGRIDLARFGWPRRAAGTRRPR